MKTINKIAVVGSDNVAAGWAARFLAQGRDVVAFVPDGDAQKLRERIDLAWPILEKLRLIPGASRDRLSVVNHLPTLVEQVDFIQISASAPIVLPELKPMIPVATNFPIVGHSNWLQTVISAPSYLSPMIEIIRHDDVDGAVLKQMTDFYRSMSMKPLVVTQSIRYQLQGAVQQVVQQLQSEGIGVADIDTALQFGDALQWLVEGLSGTVDEVIRDEALLGVMRSLRQQKLGPGALMTDHDARYYTSFEQRIWQQDDAVEAPLKLFRCDVDVSWIDYNGHMTEASYLTAFGDSSDALFRFIGINEGYRAAGHSYYTVESHINYYQECGSGDTLEFTTQILDFDEKRLHFFHSMYNAATGDLVCTTEQMLVHVDMEAGRSAAVKSHVYKALQAIMEMHQSLPTPKQVGRQMKIKKGGKVA